MRSPPGSLGESGSPWVHVVVSRNWVCAWQGYQCLAVSITPPSGPWACRGGMLAQARGVEVAGDGKVAGVVAAGLVHD